MRYDRRDGSFRKYSFFADASDKTEDSNIIYNDGGPDSTNPNFFRLYKSYNEDYGDRGYIDSDEGNFVVNLDGTKSDIRLFGIRYDIAKEGIPTGDALKNMSATWRLTVTTSLLSMMIYSY